MILNFDKSASTIRPEIIDTNSSNKVVYIRKNIIEKRTENVCGESQIYYEYDEAKLTKEEYKEYLNELSILDIQQQRADIDYIALYLGIPYDE